MVTVVLQDACKVIDYNFGVLQKPDLTVNLGSQLSEVLTVIIGNPLKTFCKIDLTSSITNTDQTPFTGTWIAI